MKLYILKPKEKLPKNDNPWEPCTINVLVSLFVQKMKNQQDKIADEVAQDENRNGHPWLDEKYSYCNILPVDGDTEFIISDIHNA